MPLDLVGHTRYSGVTRLRPQALDYNKMITKEKIYGVSSCKMSAGCVRVLLVRKDKQMESRYRKLDILSLSEVEKEIDLLMSITDLDNLSDEMFELLNSLIKLAKALGSTKDY